MEKGTKKRATKLTKGISGGAVGSEPIEASNINQDVINTISDIIQKDMLVFSREEAGWILDITHDYIQMIKHTRATSEEIRKGYEGMLKPDAQLPEGVEANQIAADLEKMKEDAKFLDVAEMRTTILRDAAQNFIMSQPDDTNPIPESNEGPSDILLNPTE